MIWYFCNKKFKKYIIKKRNKKIILKGSEEEKLLEAIENRNVKKVKIILNNSNENNKILNLNEKK